MAVVGIDIGATGSKCCVNSEEGMLLAEAYEGYQGISGDGIYEVAADQVWEGTKCAVKRAVNGISDIRAVALTSFGESFGGTRESALGGMCCWGLSWARSASLAIWRLRSSSGSLAPRRSASLWGLNPAL